MTPGRVNILGVGVHDLTYQRACDRVAEVLASDEGKGYVCVTGVHGIMEAQDDPALRSILNRALLNTPDGMPTVWIGRLRGHKEMRRVYGPDLMLELCAASVERGWTHFLYGGQEGVAEELKVELEGRFPGIRIVGTYCPPFRPLNEVEQAELRAQIAASKPQLFWVGLSTPKQERFMAAYLDQLDTRIMFGVGAAFDFHTGRAREAPRWMKQCGLQWFHRMCSNPRRLAGRYLKNNPRFIVRILLQSLGLKRYRLEG